MDLGLPFKGFFYLWFHSLNVPGYNLADCMNLPKYTQVYFGKLLSLAATTDLIVFPFNMGQYLGTVVHNCI